MTQTDKIILFTITTIVVIAMVLLMVLSAVDAIIIECVRSLCFHS